MGNEKNQRVHSFKPIYLISNCAENFTLRKRLSIAILLPTGVSANFTLTVNCDGLILQICVKWTSPMSDVRELHRLWLDNPHHEITEHHARLLGFEESLRSRRTTRDEHVRSIGNIHLPFAVETVTTEYPLRWGDGTTIVYVDLKAAVDEYANSYRNRAFLNVSKNSSNVEGSSSNVGQ